MLDAKIVSSLKEIIPNSNFKKGVYLAGQQAQKDNRFLRGRQIAFFVICEHCWVTGTHVAILDYSDLFGVIVHGDVQGFDTRWDEVLSIQRVSSDDNLETLYKMRVHGSDQLNMYIYV